MAHCTVTFSASGVTAQQNLVGVELQVLVNGQWCTWPEGWPASLQEGSTYQFRPLVTGGDWPEAPGNFVVCEATTAGSVSAPFPTAYETLYRGEVLTIAVSGPGEVVLQMYGGEGFTHSMDETLKTPGWTPPPPPPNGGF
jgi:hypothetical protein